MGSMADPKIEIRDLVAQVYGETLSWEFTEGINAYSMENMIQEELDQLNGPVDGKYKRAQIPYLQDLKKRFANTIQTIKDTPPEDFIIGESED